MTPPTSAPESIILDPSELASDRTEIDLTPWVRQEGIDWGDAQMLAYLGEQSVGSSPVDYRIPNREISIPLVIKEYTSSSFAVARRAIQSKIGLWQSQGGYLKRVVAGGGTVFCDIVTAQLHLGGGWLQAHRDVDIDAVISLQALPDFYEAEETLADHTESTLPEITFTETTLNGGDFPLGDRVRVVVDEDSISGGNNQRGMFWAFRAKHYSSATTAASAYEAEALIAPTGTVRAAMSGASGGTVVTHGTLSTNWTPVLGARLQGGSYLTHTGTNRIYARVLSAGGTTVQTRFVWDVGDLVKPVENDPARLYADDAFHILDLGEVRLDPPPAGTHRWYGQIQAKGDAGAEDLSVDRIWMVNTDESSGVLTAPPSLAQGSVAYSARSEFATESGTITGDSLAVGGTWQGAGDADDFSVAAGVATRTAVSDSDSYNGRFITASSPTLTDTAVQMDFMVSSTSLGLQQKLGLLARYTSATDTVFLRVIPDWNDQSHLQLVSVTGAGTADRLSQEVLISALGASTWYTITLYITADGFFAVWLVPQGEALRTPTFVGYNSELATGGLLDSGKVGILDVCQSAVANTRSYDNFAAWAPSSDAVVYASQSLELNTWGITREDSAGAAYGPVSIQNGDIPRMPNRSSAGTVEFMGKLSRGDLGSVPDPGIDPISARIYRRPSHLLLPN